MVLLGGERGANCFHGKGGTFCGGTWSVYYHLPICYLLFLLPLFFSLKRGHAKCALTLDLHIFHQKIIPKLTSRPYHFTVQHNYLQNDSEKKAKTKKGAGRQADLEW